MMEKAVGYIRVSSQGQVKGSGYDRQQETIGQAGYQIIKWYKESHTGTEIDRPVFNAMIEDLLGNGCRIIVVESLDRLARDLTVQLQLVAYLASKGITLINASTGQDVTKAMTENPMQKAMIQIQGVFSELDKSLIVSKLRKARQKVRQEKGRCEGRKPFGFNPKEKEILARIKQLYRKPKGQKRLGYYRIAAILNQEGHPTRTGKHWRGSTVRQILNRGRF